MVVLYSNFLGSQANSVPFPFASQGIGKVSPKYVVCVTNDYIIRPEWATLWVLIFQVSNCVVLTPSLAKMVRPVDVLREIPAAQ